MHAIDCAVGLTLLHYVMLAWKTLIDINAGRPNLKYVGCSPNNDIVIRRYSRVYCVEQKRILH